VPGAISRLASPIALPYLITASPARIGCSAILCPAAMVSTAVTSTPFASTRRPISSASSAVATLSRTLMASTAFTD
jgi:hypothetical protein